MCKHSRNFARAKKGKEVLRAGGGGEAVERVSRPLDSIRRRKTCRSLQFCQLQFAISLLANVGHIFLLGAAAARAGLSTGPGRPTLLLLLLLLRSSNFDPLIVFWEDKWLPSLLPVNLRMKGGDRSR